MKLSKQTFIILIPGFAVNEANSTCLPAQQLLVKKINKIFPELEVTIVAFQYPFTNKEYNWFGNRVIPFNGSNKNGLARLLLWIKIWKRLNQLKKQKNIVGIFSCWCNECALVGKYFSSRNNIKHYIWICGQDARATNKLVKIIKPATTSLIAISPATQKEFANNHHILPKYIVENGIDINDYNKALVERDIDILGVGSLIPLKRFEILIDVVHKLKDIKPNIQAIICGKGPERNKLVAKIKSLQLENNIQMKGEVDHDKVLQYMQRSKILMHPSSYEGFSGVCIEALYAGAHVISFRSAIEKTVKHWHIVNTNENMLQQAKKILNDHTTEFSAVLMNDMESSAKKIMALYNLNS